MAGCVAVVFGDGGGVAAVVFVEVGTSAVLFVRVEAAAVICFGSWSSCSALWSGRGGCQWS